jgi:hypothetical protein
MKEVSPDGDVLLCLGGFWISIEQQMMGTFDAMLTVVPRNEHSRETYQVVIESNEQVSK